MTACELRRERAGCPAAAEGPAHDLVLRMEACLEGKRRSAAAALDDEIRRLSGLREVFVQVDSEVLLAATDCFASPMEAVLWLTRSAGELSGRIPLEAAASPDGKEEVMAVLLDLIDGEARTASRRPCVPGGSRRLGTGA